MADPVTLDEMVEKLSAEAANVDRRMPAASSALADQFVAEARDLAADVGLDLDDPATAEMVVRMAFAMVRVAKKVMAKELEAAWIGTATAPLQVRLHTHVKAVALHRIANAALGTLTLPDIEPPTAEQVRRGKWWRRAR